MQENTRTISARVGAVSAVALLAVSGAFIAGPAMAMAPQEDGTGSAVESPAPVATETNANGTATDAPGQPATDGTATLPAQTPAPAPAPEVTPAAVPGDIPLTPTITHDPTNIVMTDQLNFGTAPGATQILLTLNGAPSTTTPINDTDRFSFKTPAQIPAGGKLTVTVQGVNGDAKSAIATYEFTVKSGYAPQPGFTTPRDMEGPLSVVTGTGVAGATVTVGVMRDAVETNEEFHTAIVGADGVWTLKLEEPLDYGTHLLSAIQDSATLKAAAVPIYLRVSVYPEAPVVVSPGNGSEIPVNKLPAEITGTAVPGATIQLFIAAVDENGELDPSLDYEDPANYEELETQAGPDGSWAVPMRERGMGSYLIFAVQESGGVTSEPTIANFRITAAVADPPVTVNPVPAGNPAPATGTLPDTGAADLGLLVGGGAALLAAGGAALLFNRRRSLVSES